MNEKIEILINGMPDLKDKTGFEILTILKDELVKRSRYLNEKHKFERVDELMLTLRLIIMIKKKIVDDLEKNNRKLEEKLKNGK